MKHSHQIVTLIIAVNLVGGCAVVSLAQIGYIKTGADVVSYATTEKGTADHALSAMTHKDCALHRILTEERMVCYDDVIITKDDVIEGITKTVDNVIDFVAPRDSNEYESIEVQILEAPVISSVLARAVPKRKPDMPKQTVAKILDMDHNPPAIADIKSKPKPVPVIITNNNEPTIEEDDDIFSMAMRFIQELKNKYHIQ